jgi:hypothetical protein
MLTYADILPDAKRILGTCEEAYILRRLNAAIELLANKGDFDPYLAVIDIAASNTTVALPPEVETVLSVNIMGRPALGNDTLFNFHLDGPGDLPMKTSIAWRWKDEFHAPVFINPPTEGRLFIEADDVVDNGKFVTIYGTDTLGNPLVRLVSGVAVPGMVITIGAVVDPLLTQYPAIIDRVTLPASLVAPIRLSSKDNTELTDTLLAIYRSTWGTEPMFKLITLERTANWVRVLFRRKMRKVSRPEDLIPLHSSEAVLMMLRAGKCYDEMQFEAGMGYEALALRWLDEEQKSRRAQLWSPPQVNPGSTLGPGADYLT